VNNSLKRSLLRVVKKKKRKEKEKERKGKRERKKKKKTITLARVSRCEVNFRFARKLVMKKLRMN